MRSPSEARTPTYQEALRRPFFDLKPHPQATHKHETTSQKKFASATRIETKTKSSAKPMERSKQEHSGATEAQQQSEGIQWAQMQQALLNSRSRIHEMEEELRTTEAERARLKTALEVIGIFEQLPLTHSRPLGRRARIDANEICIVCAKTRSASIKALKLLCDRPSRNART